MKIRLHHLTIAMLATAATVSTASANPRMGGGVSVSVPRAPVHYGNPGAGAGSAASSAAAIASRTAAEAARAGTGASGAWQVGGIDSAPRTGHIGPTGGGGPLAAAANATISSIISSGPPAGGYGDGSSLAALEAYNTQAAMEAARQASLSRPPQNVTPKRDGDLSPAAETLIVLSVLATIDVKNGANPGESGATTKVANTGPATGATPTATSSPPHGPTGGTTRTANPPGDPPDARTSRTPQEHQKLVDTAKQYDEAWKNNEAEIQRLEHIISRNRNGTATADEKKEFDSRGGRDGVSNQQAQVANQRDDNFKKYQEAQNEARKNDSYRYVR